MAFKESTTIAHPPADVFTALASEEFNRKVTEGLGGQLVAFERQGEPTGPVSVTMVRSVPVHRLPESVQKFAGKFLGLALVLYALTGLTAFRFTIAKKKEPIYGPLAAPIAIMIWLYILALAVLIGAAMPSVLAEMSFVTNKHDASLLKSTAYRQQIAEALLDAVLRYQRSLKKMRTSS